MGCQENSRRTFVLKLNLHCGYCQSCVDKVKKLVKKIQGVDSIKIEEEGKATISGNVDPHTVIKEVEKYKKIISVELWGEEEEEESPVPQVNEQEMQITVRKVFDQRKVAPQFPASDDIEGELGLDLKTECDEPDPSCSDLVKTFGETASTIPLFEGTWV